MKYIILTISLVIKLSVNAQYYDSTEISNINIARSAAEGDLYLDTIRGNYFIGLTTGEVTQINFNADSAVGSVFGIWAEEANGLNTGAFEFAYGNGDDAQAGFGIVVPTNCELFAVGLTLNNGTAEVEVYINGIASGFTSGTAGAGPANAALFQLDTPRHVSAGSVINFGTVTASGASNGGKPVAWFRTISKVPSYNRYNGSGAPSAGLGDEHDEYLNTVNGDLYTKESGAWSFTINLKGPSGASTSKGFIQMTNTASGNINNASITQFTWFDTTSANVMQNASSVFTKDIFGVTVNSTGLYKVTVFQYQITTVERSNAAVRISINGSVQPGYGANAYMRSASGHNESTASFVKIVAASAGDEIGIVNELLANTGSVTCPGGSLIFIVEEI
jgi:hypothetical protein